MLLKYLEKQNNSLIRSISYYIAILNNLNNNNYGIITRNLKLGISRAKVSVVAIRGKRKYVSDGPKDLRRWLSLRQ